MVGHILRSFRAEYHERCPTLPKRRCKPTGQPKVDDTVDMIRVQMREEKFYVTQAHALLLQADWTAAAAVKDEFFRTGLNERAWSKTVENRNRRTGAEQG